MADEVEVVYVTVNAPLTEIVEVTVNGEVIEVVEITFLDLLDGALEDAPSDGFMYVRQNGSWVKLP